MLGDKYILEPEAILDHSVLAEGKRMYLVKWKPKWVKKHELPPGVHEKWEAKKAKRAKMDPENPAPEDMEEEEEGFHILKERRLVPGERIEDFEDEGMNGEEEDDEEGEDDEEDEEEGEDEDEDFEGEEDEDGDEEEDIGIDGNADVKEEPDDEEKFADTLRSNDLNTLSSIDRDIVLNELPGQGEIKEEIEIKKEEEDGNISIPKEYAKPYS